MCGGRPSYDTGRGPSKRKRPARSVRTVALPARVYSPRLFDCQRCTWAPEIGRQSTERTTPVSTCPLPIEARRGGAPLPNGPAPSDNVGAHRCAAGADAPAPATMRTSAAREKPTATSRLTYPGLTDAAPDGQRSLGSSRSVSCHPSRRARVDDAISSATARRRGRTPRREGTDGVGGIRAVR